MAVEMTVDEERFPTLHEMERTHVERALELTGGNVSKAAKLLGVGVDKIYRRFKVGKTTEKAREVRRGTALKERLEKLREVTETASWDSKRGDNYQLGVANGLILARHIMEGRTGTPAYL